MTTINKVLCIIIITVSSCDTNQNTNGTNASGLQDTTARQSVVSNKIITDTNTAKVTDSMTHARLNLVKIDNLNCPVCRKSLSKGIEDTVTFACKLFGFDSKQCKEDFAKQPNMYKVKYK